MNVLISSTTFIPSVLLCGHCQLDYLEKQGKLNYKFVISHFTNKKNIEWADIIVFLRSDSDIDAYVSKIAKKAGKHLVYVLDDDILNVPSYLSSAPYYLLPSTQNNIRTIMSNCDTFLTTSPVLMEKYGKTFNHKFLIDEPSINRIDKKEKNNKVKIGFAGSIDRAQDLNEILKDCVEELLNKYQDSIDIEIMGAKPEFVDRLGLTHLPYQDGYDNYTAYMAKCNWDIGLAPMPNTAFHRCKYFNKYVEYASFGIAGVYSNLEPYVYGIKDKENGLLVNNTTKDWVDGISKLIEDEKLRNKISNNCLREAHEIYSLEKASEDYLNKILAGYNDNKTSKIPSLEFAKFIIFFKRVYRKVIEQGFNFPIWLKEKIDKKLNEKKEERRHNANKEKLKQIIAKQDTCFVIAPMFDDSTREYNKRVKHIDETYLKDSYNIYISGEDRLCEHLMVDLIDDKHSTIIYNSFDINQTNEILSLIESSKKCLIHSIVRFMREKISTDTFKVFDLKDTTIIWDSHGMIPEEYHNNQNFHTERVTNEIEKVFYENCDVLINETKEIEQHFISKYGKRDISYIIK